MTWLQTLNRIGMSADAELGTDAIFRPMIARPNRRGEPDPNRPPFPIRGVFDKRMEMVGTGRKNTDGLSNTSISGQVVSFSAAADAFVHPATQGDVIELCEMGISYRVADVQLAMPGRTKLVLEDMSRPGPGS